MKEIIGNKRITNAPLPNFITVKNRKILDKKEIAETFNNYFVNIGPTLAASIPKTKRHSKTIFTTTVSASVPSILRTSNWKVYLRASKQTKLQGMMIHLATFSKECPMKYLLF